MDPYPGCPESVGLLTVRFTLIIPALLITWSTQVLAPQPDYPSRSSERTGVPPPIHSATNPDYTLQPSTEQPTFKQSLSFPNTRTLNWIYNRTRSILPVTKGLIGPLSQSTTTHTHITQTIRFVEEYAYDYSQRKMVHKKTPGMRNIPG